MKIIRIVLLILIIIGLGLLGTQKFWVPPLVSIILKYEGVSPSVGVPQAVPVVPHDGMENWNWVSSEMTSQRMKFLYPNPLPTRYVSVQEWPPVVEMTTKILSCAEGDIVTEDGSPKHNERRMIQGQMYCVSSASEGAAGSTYTNYTYSVQQGDFVTSITFILRTPQCLNYDDPERTACQTEQKNFNTDALAHRIVSSITVQ